MGKKSEALTPKQSKFVDEYLKDLNAAGAYRRAGYKAKAASTIWSGTSEILRNPKVKAVLAERRAAIERRTEISQDRVRLEFGRIAFFDPRRLFDKRGKLIDIAKLPMDVAAAIESIEVAEGPDGERLKKVKLCSKISALRNLAEHLRMFAEPPPSPVNKFFNVDLRGEWNNILNGRAKELSRPATDPGE